MKLRLRLLLFAFLIAFFGPNVSAQVCLQGDSETLFKLSAPFNAHAALYNQGPHTVRACYTTLFSDPTVPTNPHPVCNPQNAIFWIVGTSNSHVNDREAGPYTTPVCYADLTCYFEQENTQSSCVLDNRYTVVALSSGSGNAHLATAGYSNQTAYPYKICCGRSSSYTQEVEWRDAAGNKVSTARAGSDTVYAVLTAATGNRTIDIYEKDSGNPDDPVLTTTHVWMASPNWSFPWTPTVADARRSENKPDYDYDHFRFTVDGKESEDLQLTFCGDNRLQLAHEQCDTGEDQDPVPSPKYGSFSSFCNATTCQLQSVSGGYCGDRVVQTLNETCDLGEGVNGNISAQSGPPGSFCSIDCQNETRNPTALRWENLEGREISHAGRGNTVRLVYRGSTTGSDFQIFEDSKTSLLQTVTGQSNGSDFFGRWKISSNLPLPKWKKLVFKNDEHSTTEFSNILTITDEGDIPIRITITGVDCGEVIAKGIIKKITVEILDPDDTVSGYIKIGDVEVDRFTNVVSRTYTKNHNFSTGGTTKIEVYAQNGRGEKASAVSNVIVHDKERSDVATAACITKPDSFKYITGDYIEFDASASNAIRQGDPLTIIPTSSLTFDWKFSDGRTNPYKSGSQLRSYQFHKSFSANLGYNWAELSVSV